MDMSAFIVAKSDQLNADDLAGGPRTIAITGVRGNDSADQPVSITFEGDGDKPYKPCKSMRRVMVFVWGPDAKNYAGQSMTLVRDPEVQFGGMKVGGIRISHMTGLDEPRTMALNATRGKKALYKVLPLASASVSSGGASVDVDWEQWFSNFKQAIAKQLGARALRAWRPPVGIPDTFLKQARTALDQRIAELEQPVQADDGLDVTLARIADSTTQEQVDAIDRETDDDRAFLTQDQTGRLDQALATRRSELRQAEAVD